MSQEIEVEACGPDPPPSEDRQPSPPPPEEYNEPPPPPDEANERAQLAERYGQCRTLPGPADLCWYWAPAEDARPAKRRREETPEPPQTLSASAAETREPVDRSAAAPLSESCPDLHPEPPPPPEIGSLAWLEKKTRWYAPAFGEPQRDDLADLYGLAPCIALLRSAMLVPRASPHLFRGALEPRHFLHFSARPGSGLRTLVDRACRAARINCCLVDGDVELPQGTFGRIVEHALARQPCCVFLDRLDGAWVPGAFGRFGAELFAAWKALGGSACDPLSVHAPDADPTRDFAQAWFVASTQLELQTLDPNYFQRAVVSARAEPITGNEAHEVCRRALFHCLLSLGVRDDRPDEAEIADLNLERRDVVEGEAMRVASEMAASRMLRCLRRLGPLVRIVSTISDGGRADGVATPFMYDQIVALAFRTATERCLSERRDLSDLDARLPLPIDFDRAVHAFLPSVSFSIANGGVGQ